MFAQVGIKIGTRKIARLAERMGIRSNVSTNWAMTLGGLKEGVSPLDMAHAYETFASGGDLVYGTLSPGADNPRDGRAPGPVGIRKIEHREDGDGDWVPVKLDDGSEAVNRTKTRNVLEQGVAEQVQSLLRNVVMVGTGTRAQVGDVPISGKTGTTEGYGDAWFVGWTPDYTIAVWVGYPNEFKSMETEFNGEPVAGGTFPAGIFKTFVESVLRIYPPEEDRGGDSDRPGAERDRGAHGGAGHHRARSRAGGHRPGARGDRPAAAHGGAAARGRRAGAADRRRVAVGTNFGWVGKRRGRPHGRISASTCQGRIRPQGRIG